jgi:hypothetical protein
LKGLGAICIQSLPFSRLASKIIQSISRQGGKSKGEDSLFRGIGDMLDGDNRF